MFVRDPYECIFLTSCPPQDNVTMSCGHHKWRPQTFTSMAHGPLPPTLRGGPNLPINFVDHWGPERCRIETKELSQSHKRMRRNPNNMENRSIIWREQNHFIRHFWFSSWFSTLVNWQDLESQHFTPDQLVGELNCALKLYNLAKMALDCMHEELKAQSERGEPTLTWEERDDATLWASINNSLLTWPNKAKSWMAMQSIKNGLQWPNQTKMEEIKRGQQNHETCRAIPDVVPPTRSKHTEHDPVGWTRCFFEWACVYDRFPHSKWWQSSHRIFKGEEDWVGEGWTLLQGLIQVHPMPMHIRNRGGLRGQARSSSPSQILC